MPPKDVNRVEKAKTSIETLRKQIEGVLKQVEQLNARAQKTGLEVRLTRKYEKRFAGEGSYAFNEELKKLQRELSRLRGIINQQQDVIDPSRIEKRLKQKEEKKFYDKVALAAKVHQKDKQILEQQKAAALRASEARRDHLKDQASTDITEEEEEEYEKKKKRECCTIMRRNPGGMIFPNEHGYLPYIRCYHTDQNGNDMACDCTVQDVREVSFAFTLSEENKRRNAAGLLVIDETQWSAQKEIAVRLSQRPGNQPARNPFGFGGFYIS